MLLLDEHVGHSALVGDFLQRRLHCVAVLCSSHTISIAFIPLPFHHPLIYGDATLGDAPV